MWTQEDKEQFSPGRAHEFADKYSKLIKLLVVSVVQMSMLYAQKHTTCKKTAKKTTTLWQMSRYLIFRKVDTFPKPISKQFFGVSQGKNEIVYQNYNK